MNLLELRARLRKEEKGLLAKFSDRINRVERLRPWFGGIAVSGALLAAISRSIEGGWGIGLTIGGAALAFFGGLLVVVLDHKKLEITQDAKEAHDIADEALSTAETAEEELEKLKHAAETAAMEATAFDAKRFDRIEAMRRMIETVEAALVTEADAAKSAGLMLQCAISRIRSAVDYHADDFLTVTIFKRGLAGSSDGEHMIPIAREWTDPARAAEPGRSWPKGKGYTGVLWNMAVANRQASVIEADTTVAGMRDKYPVDDYNAEREALYKSVAAFPILVGKSNDVWGIVTMTSNRRGVFDHQGTLPSQSVGMVRDIAMVAALLEKLDRKADGTE